MGLRFTCISMAFLNHGLSDGAMHWLVVGVGGWRSRLWYPFMPEAGMNKGLAQIQKYF